MSNPFHTDIRDELSPHDYLIRMQSAFQRPLGGPMESRQTLAQVIGVDDTAVHFTNIETKVDFTMPLNVFLLVPAVGMLVEINRVHHRIFCWPDARDGRKGDAVQLQIRL